MSLAIHNDRLLTNFATRYKLGQVVADFIAPPFKVQRPSDKYAVYGKSLQRVYNNKIAGEEKPRRIDADATEGTYTCEVYGLSTYISDRAKSNADAPLAYEQAKVSHLLDAQKLSREKRIHAIAGSASVVTQTAAATSAKWNVAASGLPVSNILTGMGVIAANGQMKPNRIVIPLQVAINMVKCAEWRDYFKYTSVQAQFSLADGLRNLGLEVMIPSTFGSNTQQGGASDPTSEEIWGDSVLLFYAEPTPSTESRTFMHSPFTYMNQVERWRENGAKGDTVQVTEEVDELLVDASLAYLITDTL